MNDYECICIVIHKNSNFKKGKLKFLNFYLKGLIVEIIKEFQNTFHKKILIKNNYNCFFPEMLLFYYMDDINNYQEIVKKDMEKLKIKKFLIFI